MDEQPVVNYDYSGTSYEGITMSMVNALAERVAGTPFHDYSGRFMFGQICPGIIVQNQTCGSDIGEALANLYRDDPEWVAWRENHPNVRLFRERDDFGKGSVYYCR